MNRIIRTKPFRQDAEELWDFIAQRSPEAADRVLDKIDAQVELLATQPRMGRERPEVRKGMRSFTLGSYVVLYYALDDGIELVRLFHTAQDYLGEFEEGSDD